MHELLVFWHAFKHLIHLDRRILFLSLVEVFLGFSEQVGAEVALAFDQPGGGGLELGVLCG